jgi:hypothetical protein
MRADKQTRTHKHPRHAAGAAVACLKEMDECMMLAGDPRERNALGK